MVVLKAKLYNIPIILSSATPSLESLANVHLKKYKHITLTQRFRNIAMPITERVDIHSMHTKCISNTLREELIKNFARSKQSLLFLNRRGYMPVTTYTDCLEELSCPNYTSKLVYHKYSNNMQYHYCVYNQKPDLACRKYGNSNFNSFAIAVEFLAEEVAIIVPDAQLLVITSNVISTRKKAQEVIDSIRNREVDIIIGTQILSKGLHFRDISLVGIIQADNTAADIRVLEPAYQIISQVAGRAGKEGGSAKIIIQSKDSANPSIKYVIANQHKRFIEEKIANRKIAKMSRFSRLISITFSSFDEHKALCTAREFIKMIPKIENVDIFCPAQAPLYLLKKHYRYRLHHKSSKKL